MYVKYNVATEISKFEQGQPTTVPLDLLAASVCGREVKNPSAYLKSKLMDSKTRQRLGV